MNNQQQIDLSKLSIVELKAFLYDLSTMLNRTQSNIQIIAKELQNRESQQAVIPATPQEDKFVSDSAIPV